MKEMLLLQAEYFKLGFSLHTDTYMSILQYFTHMYFTAGRERKKGACFCGVTFRINVEKFALHSNRITSLKLQCHKP